MPKYHCETCPDRETCKAICPTIEALLRKVTNDKRVTKELPPQFKAAILANPTEWPTTRLSKKEQSRKTIRAIRYLRKIKKIPASEVSEKLNVSVSYIKKVLRPRRD